MLIHKYGTRIEKSLNANNLLTRLQFLLQIIFHPAITTACHLLFYVD